MSLAETDRQLQLKQALLNLEKGIGDMQLFLEFFTLLRIIRARYPKSSKDLILS